MGTAKIQKAIIKFKKATNISGYHTIESILSAIPQTFKDRLTSEELYLTMVAMNDHYHLAKKSTGAEVYDSNVYDGVVWVDCISSTIEWKANEETHTFDLKAISPADRQTLNGTPDNIIKRIEKVCDALGIK